MDSGQNTSEPVKRGRKRTIRSDERKNLSGGSAGAGGVDFQAEASGLIGAKILAREGLTWVDAPGDRIPETISAETGTGGDDLRIYLFGGFIVELQSKKGLERGNELWQSLIDLAKAVEANPKVYGVLLTNSFASGTVREQLKSGIGRVGQKRMDDLPEIVTDFVDRLRKAGIKDVTDCCRRLRIIVRDFEPGSSGEEETFSALRRVADEKSIVAARNTLVSESIDLMHARGRLGAADFARRLSQAGIELSKQATNPIVFRESFLEWSVRSNETFVIPGLGLTLPIEQAWVTLRAMDSAKLLSSPRTLAKQIEEYLEWHRLAETTRSTESFSIESAAHRERLLVVVAGPGAGKSTLARRLTRVFSQKGRVTLRVSLRALATRLRKGESFEEALISAVASEGFSKSTLSTILNGSAVSLLADGLDETDPDRAIMADHLRKWGLVDDARHVTVTTRPVGHDPAWFDGWKHFELLPLGQEDVKEFAHRIYAMLFPTDASRANQRAEAFLAEVKSSRTASIASRNPQLLGLLLTLHVKGSDLSGNRYELFDRVIELIREQLSRDRTFLFELPASTARRALECIGWELLNNPLVSRNEMIHNVGTQLAREMHQQPLAGQQIAEQALGFWEERGLLEELSGAGESASVFIHLTFRDQTAAAYLSKLSEEKFIEWVRAKGVLPAFRESLLLTGGTAGVSVSVETLLKDDDVEDPISTAALLAADVLAEAESPSAQLRERVISHLLPRLTSSVPLVAYESAEKLRPLAIVSPSLIGPVARAISKHGWKWVREVGCTLALLAGDEYVDAEALLITYPEVSDTRLRSVRGSGVSIDHKPLLSELLLRGTDYLLQQGAPSDYVDAVMQKIEKADFSSGVWDQLWQKLAAHGLLRDAPPNPLINAMASIDWGLTLDRTRQFSKVILEATIEACEDLSKREMPAFEADENCIGRLYKILEVGKNPINELLDLIGGHYGEFLTEVIRGAIVAAGLNPAQLKDEAQAFLSKLAESLSRLGDLLGDDDSSDRDADWTRSQGIDLQPALLFKAIDCEVRFLCVAAAELLLNAVDRETAQQGFKETLRNGSGYALRIISQLAPTLWGSQAGGLVVDRLEQNLTADCSPLVEKLGSLVGDESTRHRAISVLSAALKHQFVPLVEAALNSVEKLELDSVLESEIRQAYEYWLKEGPEGPKESGVVPPNATAALIKHLTTRQALNFDELREALLTSEQRHRAEVREVVVPALAAFLNNDDSLTRKTLSEIADGTLPPAILYELSKSYPSVCREHIEDVLKLLESDDASVKTACIRVLADGLDRNRATPILRDLIQSQDHIIRDEAVAALRRLAPQSRLAE